MNISDTSTCTRLNLLATSTLRISISTMYHSPAFPGWLASLPSEQHVARRPFTRSADIDQRIKHWFKLARHRRRCRNCGSRCYHSRRKQPTSQPTHTRRRPVDLSRLYRLPLSLWIPFLSRSTQRIVKRLDQEWGWQRTEMREPWLPVNRRQLKFVSRLRCRRIGKTPFDVSV